MKIDLMSIDQSDYPTVFKPTGAIHIGTDLSAVERKLLNGLLYWAQLHNTAGKKGREYTLSRTMAFTLLGEKSNNIQVLRDGVETLVTTPISWDDFNKDNSGVSWEICTFLQGGKYRNGTLSYRINSYLEDKIYNPTFFAKIQLCIQAKFQGRYTIALYEYLVDELCQSVFSKAEFEVPLEEIRSLLNYDGQYKHLNNDVLKPALKDINKKTDILVKHSSVKTGRSVTSIKFEVEKKENFQLEIPLELQNYIEENIPTKESQILEKLGEAGIPKEESEILIDRFQIDVIASHLELMTKSQEEGNTIENPGQHLHELLKSNYAIPA